MDCLIYQPVGLGDIFWVQPIVDHYTDLGYEVWFPVEDIYRDLLIKYMPKEGVHWVDPNSDFPMKKLYGTFGTRSDEGSVYLPLGLADRHHPHASVMMAKYYLAEQSMSNWHKHCPIVRDFEREVMLIEAYDLPTNREHVIVNENYGTYPEYIHRDLGVKSKYHIHYMNIEQDIENGFHIFDWIRALSWAWEVHTVETSTCYLVDMYCSRLGQAHMYERRRDTDHVAYYSKTNKLYRNPDWIYHVN